MFYTMTMKLTIKTNDYVYLSFYFEMKQQRKNKLITKMLQKNYIFDIRRGTLLMIIFQT